MANAKGKVTDLISNGDGWTRTLVFVVLAVAVVFLGTSYNSGNWPFRAEVADGPPKQTVAEELAKTKTELAEANAALLKKKAALAVHPAEVAASAYEALGPVPAGSRLRRHTVVEGPGQYVCLDGAPGKLVISQRSGNRTDERWACPKSH